MTFVTATGIYFFVHQIYHVSPLKTKRRASTSPSPSTPAKKKKGGRKPKATVEEESSAPSETLESPFWNEKLDLLLKEKEKMEYKDIKVLLVSDQKAPDPAAFQSPGLELIIYQHVHGFPMFDPPPILRNLNFLGYYAITLHQRGIAIYATKDCPEATMGKIGEFLRDFQGMHFLHSF